MDPITIGLLTSLVGAGASAAGGIIGKLLAGPDQDRVRQMLERARDEYGNINLPQLQQIVAQQQGHSGMQDVQVDPKLRAAQFGALDQMQDLAKRGGLSLSDKADLNDVQDTLASTESAHRNAIRNSLAARGGDDAGAELTLGLKGGQNDAEQANKSGLRIAGMAQQRSLDAMMGAGRLGGAMEAQQFGEGADKAKAQDAINQYNTSLRTSADRYNAGLAQQQYENQLARAGGMAGADRSLASYYQGQANGTRQEGAAVGAGVGQGLNALAAWEASQKKEQPQGPGAGPQYDESFATAPQPVTDYSTAGAGDAYQNYDDPRRRRNPYSNGGGEWTSPGASGGYA